MSHVDAHSCDEWDNTWDRNPPVNPWAEAAGWLEDLLPHLGDLARANMHGGLVQSPYRSDAQVAVHSLLHALAAVTGVQWDEEQRGSTARADAAEAITLLRCLTFASALDGWRLGDELPRVEQALRANAEAWAEAAAVEQTIVDAQSVPEREAAWQRQDPAEVAQCRREVRQCREAEEAAADKIQRVRVILTVLPPAPPPEISEPDDNDAEGLG